MNRTHGQRLRRAFTILELLIVLAILLAIGGVVLINVMGAHDKALRQTTLVQMQQFAAALDRFHVDMKRYPTQEEGLKVLWTKEGLEEADAAKWSPYLTQPRKLDEWGTEFVYKIPSDIEGIEFDIISWGPDKQEGTDDDISLAKEKQKSAGGEDAFSDFKNSSGSGSSSSGSGGGSTR